MHTQVTEVGTMNIFFMWTNKQGKKELITVPLCCFDAILLTLFNSEFTVED
jgi:branched-subunit amino acid aminotransferase/4-amino-4-deoxychorismate lyase